MDPSRSLTSYPAPPTQPFQQFFAGASNFFVGGGQFNAIGGDYIASSIDPDQLERLLAQLRQAELAYRSVSQHVGYSSANGVTIIDALDERFILPLSIVSEFEDVHDSLLKHFRGVIGEELVAEKKYRIARQHDGQLVKPEDWKEVLETGDAVVMSMLIEKVWVESIKDVCPKCGRTRLGSSREGGWLKWYSLSSSLVYVVLPLEMYIPLAERSVLLLSRLLYVVLSLEAQLTLADLSVLLLPSDSYVFLPWHYTYRSLTVPCSSSYVVLPPEPYLPLADRSVLLLSSGPSPSYVLLPLELYIPLADRSVILLSSPLYVVPRLEAYIPFADRPAILLSSALYVILSLKTVPSPR
ncbi:hypothetical protein DFP72DRAFT_1077867 [Ephemerocybe angulata]|uniref:Ubiquitin-like domain-containing protein n=1 Tax=Ephemerocybe angulata TaxID=980116 RepID=A0A8H6HFC2_9AGAR|nr:hypothetical protein DFP72DRAFT_1077867 [Tulosesus angulatus]